MSDDSRSHLIALFGAIDPAFFAELTTMPIDVDVIADVDNLLEAFRLQKIRRYFHQVHWLQETRSAMQADEVEKGLKLENVAAHSWHVADAAMLLAGHFKELNRLSVLQLALIHDKLEIYTGDFDPVGSDGQGTATHAFNRQAQRQKRELELQALAVHLKGLPLRVREEQKALFEESIAGATREARFVKAVDKLQALAFVHEKKNGMLSDSHLRFSIRYSYRSVQLFPQLFAHYVCLLERFLGRVASQRHCEVVALLEQLAIKIEAERSVSREYVRLALIGKSGAGKSEVSRRLSEMHGFATVKTGVISRAISKILFGNEDKASTQKLDDALTPIDPSIFLTASLRDAELDQNVVIDSLRFVDDVKLAKRLGFKTLRVTCDEKLRWARLASRGQTFDPSTDGFHRSEIELDTYAADYEIHNHGTLADLNLAIDSLAQRLQ